jgi:hypothetical protein
MPEGMIKWITPHVGGAFENTAASALNPFGGTGEEGGAAGRWSFGEEDFWYGVTAEVYLDREDR